MSPRRHNRIVFGAAVTGAAIAGALWASGAAAQEVTFKDDVFPIIELRCLECHQPGGDGYKASGLDMRTYASLMKGTSHGPVVLPGKAFESNLIAVIDQRTDPTLWMPHNKKKLSKCERLMLRFWISQGAKDN
jgi:Planctomycete cytochrome C